MHTAAKCHCFGEQLVAVETPAIDPLSITVVVRFSSPTPAMLLAAMSSSLRRYIYINAISFRTTLVTDAMKRFPLGFGRYKYRKNVRRGITAARTESFFETCKWLRGEGRMVLKNRD